MGLTCTYNSRVNKVVDYEKLRIMLLNLNLKDGAIPQ